jgi:hypothetical protein
MYSTILLCILTQREEDVYVVSVIISPSILLVHLKLLLLEYMYKYLYW